MKRVIFFILLIIVYLPFGLIAATEQDAEEQEVEQLLLNTHEANLDPRDYFEHKWKQAQRMDYSREKFAHYVHAETGYRVKFTFNKYSGVTDNIILGKHFVDEYTKILREGNIGSNYSHHLGNNIKKYGFKRIKEGFLSHDICVYKYSRNYYLRDLRTTSYNSAKREIKPKIRRDLHHIKNNLYTRNNSTTNNSKISAYRTLRHDKFDRINSPLSNKIRETITSKQFVRLNSENAF